MKLLSVVSKRVLQRNAFGSKRKVKEQPPWNVMFFGTDDFALKSLIALHKGKERRLIGKLDVVTAALKRISPVQQYCKEESLNILNWPLDVPLGIYDVGAVVSFGHLLPPAVINAFPFGILNVHGSLLPRWRGAAPIIHALLNKDQITGVTVMEIQPHRFDVGNIVSKATIEIPWNIKSGALTTILADMGARELINVMENLPEKLANATQQPQIGITTAAKPKEEASRINWALHTCRDIQARYRALDDHIPLWTTWQGTPVKLRAMALHKEWSQPVSEKIEERLIKENSENQNKISNENISHENLNTKECLQSDKTLSAKWNVNNINRQKPGAVMYNKKKKTMSIRCSDGWVSFCQVNIKNRKPMTPHEFYNGFIGKVNSDMRNFQ